MHDFLDTFGLNATNGQYIISFVGFLITIKDMLIKVIIFFHVCSVIIATPTVLCTLKYCENSTNTDVSSFL